MEESDRPLRVVVPGLREKDALEIASLLNERGWVHDIHEDHSWRYGGD